MPQSNLKDTFLRLKTKRRQALGLFWKFAKRWDSGSDSELYL